MKSLKNRFLIGRSYTVYAKACHRVSGIKKKKFFSVVAACVEGGLGAVTARTHRVAAQSGER